MSRERQILDAAAALFYEKGFHGVGVDQIGERVGISGPALYRHFRGKDEILAALFNEALEELISATAAVYTDPHRDLERLIRHHVDFAINRRHLVSVYEREQRPWLPHLTVVRFRERPRLRPPLPDLGEVSPSDAAVYHSLLRSTGAQYAVVESFALGG